MLHPRVTAILAAANLNNLNIHVDTTFDFGTTNKTPAFRAKFPHGKIPALETSSGLCLAESSAIMRYVSDSGPAREQLLGRTPEDRGLVSMWMSFADTEIWPCVSLIANSANSGVGPTFLEKKKGDIARSLDRLELHLAQEGKVWLVRDDEISLGDINVASTVMGGFKTFMNEEYRSRYPKIMAWWERLMAVEGVGKAFGAPVQLV